MAGTCDRERSRSGVSLWDEAPGWGGCIARGNRMFRQAGHRLAPCEDVLFGHPKD